MTVTSSHGNSGSEETRSCSAVASGASQIPTLAVRPGIRQMRDRALVAQPAGALGLRRAQGGRLGMLGRQPDLHVHEDLHQRPTPSGDPNAPAARARSSRSSS